VIDEQNDIEQGQYALGNEENSQNFPKLLLSK